MTERPIIYVKRDVCGHRQIKRKTEKYNGISGQKIKLSMMVVEKSLVSKSGLIVGQISSLCYRFSIFLGVTKTNQSQFGRRRARKSRQRSCEKTRRMMCWRVICTIFFSRRKNPPYFFCHNVMI